MRTIIALLSLSGGLALLLVGCSDSTDAGKAANDAYHNRDAGPRPPAGATTHLGPAVGPFANSGGVPPGSGAPYTGQGSGPGKAPTAPPPSGG